MVRCCVALLFSLLLHLACNGITPTDMAFPQLTVYDAEGESSSFPQAKKGLVFLGFQLDAKEELLLWYKALLRNEKISQQVQCTVLPVLPAWMDCSVTRSPVITFCKKAFPQKVLPFVKMAFFDDKKLSTLLGLSSGNTEHIHVFYLNEHGCIRWRATGRPTTELLAQLTKTVQELVA